MFPKLRRCCRRLTLFAQESDNLKRFRAILFLVVISMKRLALAISAGRPELPLGGPVVRNTGWRLSPESRAADRNPAKRAAILGARAEAAIDAWSPGVPTIAERSSPWGRWRGGARLFGPRGGAAWTGTHFWLKENL